MNIHPADVLFVRQETSITGRVKLLVGDDDIFYQIKRNADGTIYFRCRYKKKGCGASLTTTGNMKRILRINLVHKNH